MRNYREFLTSTEQASTEGAVLCYLNLARVVLDLPTTADINVPLLLTEPQLALVSSSLLSPIVYLRDESSGMYIFKIYDSPLAASEIDGWKDVEKGMKKGLNFGSGEFRKLVDVIQSNPDEINSYLLRHFSDNPKPLLDVLRVVKLGENKELLGIYPNYRSVPGIDSDKVLKYLHKKDKVLYKKCYLLTCDEYFASTEGDLSHPTEHTKVVDTAGTQLKVLLTLNSKIVSVNDLYKAKLGYKNGRPYPVIYKNQKAKDVGAEVRRQLLCVDFSNYREWLENTTEYKISINFILKSGISRRDVGNLDKSLCDDLVRFIRNDLGISHFDDSEFLECHFYKSIIPNAEHEYAYIILENSDHSVRFDSVDKSEKSYIEFTENVGPVEALQFKNSLSGRSNLIVGRDYTWDSGYKSYLKECCDTIEYYLTEADFQGPNAIRRFMKISRSIDRCVSESTGFINLYISGKVSDPSKKIIEDISKSIVGSRVKIYYVPELNAEVLPF